MARNEYENVISCILNVKSDLFGRKSIHVCPTHTWPWLKSIEGWLSQTRFKITRQSILPGYYLCILQSMQVRLQHCGISLGCFSFGSLLPPKFICHLAFQAFTLPLGNRAHADLSVPCVEVQLGGADHFSIPLWNACSPASALWLSVIPASCACANGRVVHAHLYMAFCAAPLIGTYIRLILSLTLWQLLFQAPVDNSGVRNILPGMYKCFSNLQICWPFENLNSSMQYLHMSHFYIVQM